MPDNLDVVLEALRRSAKELDLVILEESALDNVSIEDACEALRVQTMPVDIQIRESRPKLYQHKVWRGPMLLHVALYEAASAEEARKDGRHYYAWDRVSKVELVHPNGTVEEI